jgi:hypothetical protein
MCALSHPLVYLVSHGLLRHNALRRCRSTKATPRVQVGQTSSRNVTPCINAHASTSQVKEEDDDKGEDPPKTKARVGKTKYSADEIIEIMRNAEDDDKDEVIQKVFMVSDF